jgi:hypothetical protein
MQEAVQELLRNAGILGPIVIFFGWYILLKDRQLKDMAAQLAAVNDARVKDAQAQVAELMNLNDKWVTALNSNTVVLQEIKTLITIIRGGGSLGPSPRKKSGSSAEDDHE